MTAEAFTIRAASDGVVAIDCHNAYTRSKPSFLVPKTDAIATASATDGTWSLETKTLRVVADAKRVRIFRKSSSGPDPIAEIRDFSTDGAAIFIDRGYAAYGVGGNNAWQFRDNHDIDELTDVDLDRWGHSYLVHHRVTGQGNNFFPWLLSAQGFGLFFDSPFPMTVDLRDTFAITGKNIRSFYFIDGPTPAEAVQNYVKLTGLPPMHPAWALGYEQSSRAWMNHGELDFVTTYFREKKISVDGLDLLTTYDGRGGIGQGAKGFHAGYLDYYQGWHVKGDYKTYNPKLLPNGADDIKMLRDRGFRPIVHGYWVGDFSDEGENEKLWQDHKPLLTHGWSGWWLDGTEYRDVADGSSFDQSYQPPDAGKFTDEFRDEHDNVWALLRSKAFYERQRRDFPDQRVYILNRTVFPGVQAYATGVNQGDYWSSWKLMGIETVWLLQMGMSGIFFPETDIGGHWPTSELTDELFIRWAFLATFSPIMRSHGHNWRCRLPWGFGPENEARFVPLIKLRSEMFPYNYTLLAEANQHGTPMMRAMILEFPKDPAVRRIWDQFMWGPNLLVAPVYEKGARQRNVYLPAGTWVISGQWTRARAVAASTLTLRSARIRCSCAPARSRRCALIHRPFRVTPTSGYAFWFFLRRRTTALSRSTTTIARRIAMRRASHRASNSPSRSCAEPAVSHCRSAQSKASTAGSRRNGPTGSKFLHHSPRRPASGSVARTYAWSMRRMPHYRRHSGRGRPNGLWSSLLRSAGRSRWSSPETEACRSRLARTRPSPGNATRPRYSCLLG